MKLLYGVIFFIFDKKKFVNLFTKCLVGLKSKSMHAYVEKYINKSILFKFTMSFAE